MSDEWMPTIRFPLSPDSFGRLPRNSAYRYEYLAGQACLNPRPKHYHALLALQKLPVDHDLVIRQARQRDLDHLVPLFASCFEHIQPFGSLDDGARRLASRQALQRTWQGGDGPWIQEASFVACQGRDLIGCILITLLPKGDPCAWDSYHWSVPPPLNCIEQCLGRPHLTWVFVRCDHAGQGAGSCLLAVAVNQLIAMGFTELLSTFMIGNDASALWHWRNGFRLLAHPGSYRTSALRNEIKTTKSQRS